MGHPPDRTKVHGSVIVEGILMKTGEVRDLHVVSGLAALRPGAMEDAKKMHMAPLKVEDHPVDSVIDLYLQYPELSR